MEYGDGVIVQTASFVSGSQDLPLSKAPIASSAGVGGVLFPPPSYRTLSLVIVYTQMPVQ